MDKKEDLIRYVYIKNGDVVTQLNRILPIGKNISSSGPDAFISDLIHFIDNNPALLISCQNRDSNFKLDNIEGKVYNCRNNSSNPFIKIVSRFFTSFKIFFLLLNFKPERIICGTNGWILWVSYLFSALYSIPFIHSNHTSLLTYENSSYKRFFLSLSKWCMLHSKAEICHGPYLRQQLLDIGVDSSRLFEFDIGFQDISREMSNKQESIVSDENMGNTPIFYIGRIEAYKGAFDLFEACKEILSKNADVKLVYIGNGSALKELQERVIELNLKEQVLFLGEVNRERLFQTIKKARVIVTPTQGIFYKGKNIATEGRCMTAMESLFFGIPLIAPDSGPFPYLIKHGVNGMLFETNSIDSLKKTIQEVFKDEVFYRQLCEGAKQTGENLLSPEMTFAKAVKKAFSVSS